MELGLLNVADVLLSTLEDVERDVDEILNDTLVCGRLLMLLLDTVGVLLDVDLEAEEDGLVLDDAVVGLVLEMDLVDELVLVDELDLIDGPGPVDELDLVLEVVLAVDEARVVEGVTLIDTIVLLDDDILVIGRGETTELELREVFEAVLDFAVVDTEVAALVAEDVEFEGAVFSQMTTRIAAASSPACSNASGRKAVQRWLARTFRGRSWID